MPLEPKEAAAGASIPVDRKYRFIGFNATNGKVYTEDNAMLFAAKDQALPDTLRFYRAKCEALGCERAHLDALDLLIGRVEAYQRDVQSKVPDTSAEEQVRTVHGILRSDLPRRVS